MKKYIHSILSNLLLLVLGLFLVLPHLYNVNGGGGDINIVLNNDQKANTLLNQESFRNEAALKTYFDTYELTVGGVTLNKVSKSDQYGYNLIEGSLPTNSKEIALSKNILPKNAKIGSNISVIIAKEKITFSLQYTLSGILRTKTSYYLSEDISEDYKERLMYYFTTIDNQTEYKLKVDDKTSVEIQDIVISNSLEKARIEVSQDWLDSHQLTLDGLNNSKDLCVSFIEIFSRVKELNILRDFSVVISMVYQPRITIDQSFLDDTFNYLNTRCYSYHYENKYDLKKDLSELNELYYVVNSSKLNTDNLYEISTSISSVLTVGYITYLLVLTFLALYGKERNQSGRDNLLTSILILIGTNLVLTSLFSAVCSFNGVNTFIFNVFNIVILTTLSIFGIVIYLHSRFNKTKYKEKTNNRGY